MKNRDKTLSAKLRHQQLILDFRNAFNSTPNTPPRTLGFKDHSGTRVIHHRRGLTRTSTLFPMTEKSEPHEHIDQNSNKRRQIVTAPLLTRPSTIKQGFTPSTGLHLPPSRNNTTLNPQTLRIRTTLLYPPLLFHHLFSNPQSSSKLIPHQQRTPVRLRVIAQSI